LARLPGVGLVQALPNTAGFLVGTRARQRRHAVNLDGAPARPRLRPTPGLALQVAIDEAMLGIFGGPNRLPTRADYERVGGEVRAAEAVWRRRGWVDDPFAYHALPPPLEQWDTAPAASRGLCFEHLTFESGYRPHPDEPGRDRWLAYLPNHTGHAWVLRHAGPPRPWLVCLHGLGMGIPIADFAAFKAKRLHVELGLNLLFPVLPLHGPRRVGRIGGDSFLSFDHLNMVHGLAQSAWDTRRLIDWTRGQGAPAVGLYGISLGGYTAALVAALDGGLDAAIAGVPVVDFARLFAHHCPPKVRERGLEHDLLGPRAATVHRVVSPLAGPSLVARERRFVYAGLGDRLATAGQAQGLWEHWERPPIEWYAGNHVGFLWSRQVDRFVRRSLAASGFLGGDVAKPAGDVGMPAGDPAVAVAGDRP